jgi:hypothetical protein
MSFDIYDAWYKFLKNTMLTMPRKDITIGSIFGKNEDKRKNPQLYKYVLRYSTAQDGSFTHWDLARWLYDHYPEFKERYKDFSTRTTTIPTRIEHTQESTKNSLNDLIKLDLINIIAERKITKGTGYTPLYAFTWYGKLLAWINESFDIAKREKTDKEIYNLFAHNATHFHTSLYILGSALHKKYIRNRVFDDFVVDILRRKLESDNPGDMNELLECLAIPIINHPEKARYHTQLWRETFNEMEPEIQQLLLHSIKLSIEAKVEREAKYPEGFEIARFNYRERHDMVAIVGYCKNCGCNHSIGVEIIYYLERTQLPSEDPFAFLGDCRECNTKSSVIYPKFEY